MQLEFTSSQRHVSKQISVTTVWLKPTQRRQIPWNKTFLPLLRVTRSTPTCCTWVSVDPKLPEHLKDSTRSNRGQRTRATVVRTARLFFFRCLSIFFSVADLWNKQKKNTRIHIVTKKIYINRIEIIIPPLSFFISSLYTFSTKLLEVTWAIFVGYTWVVHSGRLSP